MKREFGVEFNYEDFLLIKDLLANELVRQIFERKEIDLDYTISVLSAYKRYNDVECYLADTSNQDDNMESVTVSGECSCCGACECAEDSDDEDVEVELEFDTGDDGIDVHVEIDDVSDFIEFCKRLFA